MGELGLKPAEFWDMTYAEFVQMAEGYQRVQKNRYDELLYFAWHIEAFARQKTLPSLESLMRKIDNKQQHRTQTDEEMLAMGKMLNAAFGGEVVEI